jgi:sRNA-binding protein
MPSDLYVISLLEGAIMASKYAMERARGKKESRRQLIALREKWPAAFPAENQDVRPLSTGAAGQIAAAMDWSLPYTLGVLSTWKMASVYCQAVLRYAQRIGLDCSPAESVDVEAKDLATKRLAELTARESAKKASKSLVRGTMEPKPAPTPTAESGEQLRARVRASLLRRSA